MKGPWVQIAVDARDIDNAKRIAKMAVNAGADWIEAGTPLITFQSVRAIGTLVETCPGIPVVADFKAQDGVGKYFTEAGVQGAKLATVLGLVPNAAIRAAVDARPESGVQVVVDLYGVKNLAERAKEVENLGVDYVLLHLGFDEARAAPLRNALDGLIEILKATSLPVGVGTFNQAEAVEAIRLGASFVVQGEPILSAPNAAEQLRDFVSAVKSVSIGE